MGFAWDPDKARTNFRKHGVRFSTEAQIVFSDDFAITVADEEDAFGEQRFVTVGMGAKGRVLVVVYCYRQENIRIISARPADPRECEMYEAQR